MTTTLQEDPNSYQGVVKRSAPLEVSQDGALSSKTQQEARPRALSDISIQSADADVGVVVLKAKRAAKSLWMIIHAQNCRLSGKCCPHRGCEDTKRLLLHVKSCPAGPGFNCPEGFNGCLQAKKLLSHYRRCRDIRARQARQPPAKRLLRQQQHSCLVCSLMARHARTVLDASGKAIPSSICISSNKETKRAEHPIPHKYRDQCSSSGDEQHSSSPSIQAMPPPPPRLPHQLNQHSRTLNEVSPSIRLSSPIPSLDTADHISTTDQSASISTHRLGYTHGGGQIQLCFTPPSQSVLQQKRITDVAAATASSPIGSTVDPSLLGKSIDSSKSSFLCRMNPHKTDDVLENETSHGKSTHMDRSPSRQRIRAESYDEPSSGCSMSSILSENTRQNYGNDPTIEATLKTESVSQRELVQNLECAQSHLAKQLRFGKRRSASCGVLTSLSRSACDTIEENSIIDDDNMSDDEPIFMCDEDKR
mmetsp:Transcript_31929/g.95614  ORF Transcript_31929/g.95614 Transcript_31929/m.95614 type:complete len:477 (-) Transcript_31929:108-1538(-)